MDSVIDRKRTRDTAESLNTEWREATEPARQGVRDAERRASELTMAYRWRDPLNVTSEPSPEAEQLIIQAKANLAATERRETDRILPRLVALQRDEARAVSQARNVLAEKVRALRNTEEIMARRSPTTQRLLFSTLTAIADDGIAREWSQRLRAAGIE